MQGWPSTCSHTSCMTSTGLPPRSKPDGTKVTNRPDSTSARSGESSIRATGPTPTVSSAVSDQSPYVAVTT